MSAYLEDRAKEDEAVHESFRWLFEMRNLEGRMMQKPVSSSSSSGSASFDEVEHRRLVQLEKQNADTEFASLEKGLETTIYKTGAVTAGAAGASFLFYRRILPQRPLGSTVLALMSTYLAFGAARNTFVIHGVQKDFVRQLPPEQHPYAARTRAQLRAHCPTHPFLADIPATQDITPSQAFLEQRKLQ